MNKDSDTNLLENGLQIIIFVWYTYTVCKTSTNYLII